MLTRQGIHFDDPGWYEIKLLKKECPLLLSRIQLLGLLNGKQVLLVCLDRNPWSQ